MWIESEVNAKHAWLAAGLASPAYEGLVGLDATAVGAANWLAFLIWFSCAMLPEAIVPVMIRIQVLVAGDCTTSPRTLMCLWFSIPNTVRRLLGPRRHFLAFIQRAELVCVYLGDVGNGFRNT